MSTTTPKRQTFPQKLREAIDRKAISISELARRVSDEKQDVDAARRSIHKHLNGEAKPRRDMRRKYEKALDLAMHDLDDSEADPVEDLMTALRAVVRSELKGVPA